VGGPVGARSNVDLRLPDFAGLAEKSKNPAKCRVLGPCLRVKRKAMGFVRLSPRPKINERDSPWRLRARKSPANDWTASRCSFPAHPLCGKEKGERPRLALKPHCGAKKGLLAIGAYFLFCSVVCFRIAPPWRPPGGRAHPLVIEIATSKAAASFCPRSPLTARCAAANFFSQTQQRQGCHDHQIRRLARWRHRHSRSPSQAPRCLSANPEKH